MKHSHSLLAALLLAGPSPNARGGDSAAFNYAEALQKSLYFYEAQQAGRLEPGHRVPWRGNACLTDGQEIGRDLSGGWFDAGDHWTANLTMAFAAMTLAWSAVEHPEAYTRTGQMGALLGNLIHVNDYFLRCVLNPETQDPATELDVVIGCGGREGVDPPNVHAMWAPAEVAHLLTRRPAFRVNKQVPAGDIPAAMAAAMAASSMVIRDHANALREQPGYIGFNAAAFADTLLDRAAKLTLFARANAGPALTDKLPQAEQDRIRKARRSALRSDGNVVETGYRADPFDKILAAASWLQRAHLAKDPGAGREWFALALQVYENEYKAESGNDWWKDFGAGHFGKLAAFNLMRLAPDDERFHNELQLYCTRFTEYRQTPGGLRLREWFAHEYGSLRHANNAAVIALYYSDYVDNAPPLQGNTWWKRNRSNAELKSLYFREAKRQVDYALGANPYQRSFLVGFGQTPFNNVHHRGAYGAWAGFHHFLDGKPEYRPAENRHILYGALVAGPDHNDVFLCGQQQHTWLPLPHTNTHGAFYRFPNRPAPVPKEGYVWNPADPVVQEVMDSQFNEVALDYNAGITASFAWLTAQDHSSGQPLPDSHFPPPESRHLTTNLLTTDREFFVAARNVRTDTLTVEIEATLFNRSRWPARVTDQLGLRYYFTLDGATRPSDVTATLLTPDAGAVLGPITVHRGQVCCILIRFPGVPIFPGDRDRGHDLRQVRFRLGSPSPWDNSNDWSHSGMTTEPALLPRIPVFENERKLAGEEPT